MSSGFHRLGANAGKVPGFSNSALGSGDVKGSNLLIGDMLAQHAVEGPRSADPVLPKLDATLLDVELGGMPAMGKAQAVQSGYTGDQCSHCSSMRMKVSGHCMVCEDCGTTTGCS